jgi:hypothetical protein
MTRRSLTPAPSEVGMPLMTCCTVRAAVLLMEISA